MVVVVVVASLRMRCSRKGSEKGSNNERVCLHVSIYHNIIACAIDYIIIHL